LIESLNPHWLDLSRGWYSQIRDGYASSARAPSAQHDTSPREIIVTTTSPHHVILSAAGAAVSCRACGVEESLLPRRTSFRRVFSSILNRITSHSTGSPQQSDFGIVTSAVRCPTIPAEKCLHP
jgi:hypothetical protein